MYLALLEYYMSAIRVIPGPTFSVWTISMIFYSPGPQEYLKFHCLQKVLRHAAKKVRKYAKSEKDQIFGKNLLKITFARELIAMKV